MASTTDTPPRRAAAAAAAAAAVPTVLSTGLEAVALFRQLFPNVNNKRKRGWNFQPDVGYRACNELRNRHHEAVPTKLRVANALSLNSTANARSMETAAAASSGGSTAGPGSFYLYSPAELRKAAAAGFSETRSRALKIVNTRAAADELIQRGYILFTSIDIYDTETTGLSNLPFPEEEASERAPPAPLHEVPPPTGPVTSLPKTMPPFYEGASTVDQVIESFEIKVVDTKSNCIWHPIRMWSQVSDERKKLGFDDGSNLYNRLVAYYAAKCGEHTVAELQDKSFSKLLSLGRACRSKRKGNGGKASTFFELCVELFRSQHM